MRGLQRERKEEVGALTHRGGGEMGQQETGAPAGSWCQWVVDLVSALGKF